MVLKRREFLKGSAAFLLGAGFLHGCKENEESWEYKISTLQKNAGSQKDGVNYEYLKGFVYDVEVAGREVYVNLARDYFERRGHELKYTTGDTSVCVFKGNKVVVEDKNSVVINDPNVIQQATELTNLVLNALVDKQTELVKGRRQRYEASAKRAMLDLTYK